MKLSNYTKIFKTKELPKEFVLLFEFEQKYGAETYAGLFSLTTDQGILTNWSEDKLFKNNLIVFATATGSNDCVYALWNDGSNKPLNQMPIAIFGDEGGVHIVAEDILQLIKLLTWGANPMVEWEEVSFSKIKMGEDFDTFEGENNELFQKWAKQYFNIEAIATNPAKTSSPEVNKIVSSAQKKYKKTFKKWLSEFGIDDL